jgi:hypothetical protein
MFNSIQTGGGRESAGILGRFHLGLPFFAA